MNFEREFLDSLLGLMNFEREFLDSLLAVGNRFGSHDTFSNRQPAADLHHPGSRRTTASDWRIWAYWNDDVRGCTNHRDWRHSRLPPGPECDSGRDRSPARRRHRHAWRLR